MFLAVSAGTAVEHVPLHYSLKPFAFGDAGGIAENQFDRLRTVSQITVTDIDGSPQVLHRLSGGDN